MFKKLFLFIILIPLLVISVLYGLKTYRSKEQTIEYAGLKRKYRVHYPRDFSDEGKIPLVIVLHGFLTDARMSEIYSEFSSKADEEKFVALYPYAYKKNFYTPAGWNASFCCGWAYENSIDDVGFIDKLIYRLEGLGGIDESRIYVVGVSNGGMFANHLAMQLPEKFAGVASIAGAIGAQYEDDDETTYLEKSYKSVPAILIHGRKDPIVPFDGGPSKYRLVEFPSAYDTLGFWLDNNKCSKHPASISNQEYVTHEVYKDCENSSVEFYAVDTKHTWPGSLHDFPAYVLGRSVKATDIIWEFFEKQLKIN